jgi:hypothetical protein
MFETEFDTQSTQKRYIGMFALAGHFAYFYPGANTIIEIEIGMTATDYNCAEITGDFTVIVDGPSLFQKFCTGPHQNCPPSS